MPSYFNRTFRHYSSHHHAPDNSSADPIGVAVSATDAVGYIAYPIFTIYHAMGQPLYKYMLRGLIDRLMPNRSLLTDLPSGGRVTLVRQERENRHVLHLLYGAPQVRGKRVPIGESGHRVMEMIEDLPTLGPVTVSLLLDAEPMRVFDALTGEDIDYRVSEDGRTELVVPSLHIHRAVVLQTVP